MSSVVLIHRAFNFGASELIGLIMDQQIFSSQAPVDIQRIYKLISEISFIKKSKKYISEDISQLSPLNFASISSAISQAASFGYSALYMLLPTITQSAPAAITSEAFPP